MLEDMKALAHRGKTEFRHLLAQPVNQSRAAEEWAVSFSCQGIFFMENKYIKIPNYSIYISHVFFFQLRSHSNSIHLLPTFFWVIFHHEPCFIGEANSLPSEITVLLFTISLPGNSALAASASPLSSLNLNKVESLVWANCPWSLF